MKPSAPLVDGRSYQDLVRETEDLLRGYLPVSANAPIPGLAFVRIYARLAELVVERLNRVPQKNFLAFLDLIGVSPLPPQPARVPLTFTLAAGATEAVVPARTPVAALPFGGEDEPPTFQTEADLFLTRSDLIAAFVREPDRDVFADVTNRAVGPDEAAFAAFEGDRPIEHALYVGDASFALEPAKSIVVVLEGREGDAPWPHAVEWSRWDGAAWAPVRASFSSEAGPSRWRLAFGDVPPIPPRQIGDLTASWLRGTLRPLRQRGLTPDAAFADDDPLPVGQTLHPFGDAIHRDAFYLGCERAFSKPGAAVEIDVAVDEKRAVEPRADLGLAWEYWNGVNWQRLAMSRPGPMTEADRAPGSEFDDATKAFTSCGRVSFVAPTDWAPSEHGGVTTHWLRVRVAAGEYGKPRPGVVRLAVAYACLVPCVVGVRTSVAIERDALAPEAAVANGTPVDLDKDFLPFGAEPRFNDTFYLVAEPFSRPEAVVTLGVELTNPADATATPAPAVPSDDLVLRWEYWNGTKETWDVLGESGTGVSRPAGDLADKTDAFTKNGLVEFTVPPGAAPREVSGQLRSWIRVRIVQGNYGHGAAYELKDKEDKDKGYVVVPASFSPPSLRSLRVSYRFEDGPAPPDAIVTENDFRTANAAAPFVPFRPPTDADPTLYLGFEPAGEMQAFANCPTSLFLSVVPALYEPGRRSGETVRTAVAWEYWNGAEWTRLPVIDETRALTRSGVVRFIGPADFRASTEFARAAFWLRVRWESGRFASPPRLRRVLTNTVWATNAVRVAAEVLGSSTGEPGQTFATTRAPVLADERIEVREAGPPTAGERAGVELAPEGAAVGPVAGQPPAEVWVRWEEVPDFHGSGPEAGTTSSIG